MGPIVALDSGIIGAYSWLCQLYFVSIFCCLIFSFRIKHNIMDIPWACYKIRPGLTRWRGTCCQTRSWHRRRRSCCPPGSRGGNPRGYAGSGTRELNILKPNVQEADMRTDRVVNEKSYIVKKMQFSRMSIVIFVYRPRKWAWRDFVKLWRPAYFFGATQLLPHPGHK